MNQEKVCGCCGLTLVQKPKERNFDFRKRAFCGLKCSQKVVQRRTPEWLFNKYVERGEGCWIWNGPRDSCNYGRMRVRGRTTGAHRWSYEHHVGPVAPGLLVCHHCDNPPCVNPAHLFVGTDKDNTQDSVQKGRWSEARKRSNATIKARRAAHATTGR